MLKNKQKTLTTLLFAALLLTSFFIVLVEIPTAKATTIFSDGFETGDLSQWTSNTTSGSGALTIDSSIPYNGTYALNASRTADAGTAYVSKTIDAIDTCYAQFAFRSTSLPPSGTTWVIASLYKDGTYYGELRWNNTGGTTYWETKFTADGGVSVQTVNDTSTISSDNYYIVQFCTIADATAGGMECWVNGTKTISSLASDTDINLNDIVGLKVGLISTLGSGSARTFTLDEVQISDTFITSEDEEPPETVYTFQDIQDLIDAADANDTITLNGGTYYWYGDRVNVTKVIHLDANYSTFQQVNDGAFGTMFYITATGGITNITKANFIGNVTSSDDDLASGSAITLFDCKQFRISYNNFTDFPNVAIGAYGNVASWGVIDHNRITNPYKAKYGGGGWGYGIIVSSNDYWSWDGDITHFLGRYDTVNSSYPNVYIEDNYMNNTRHAVASNQRGWYVIRNNTLEQQVGNSIVDVHGAGEIGAGGRGLEAYNNTLIGGSYGFALRGGSGVVYNNTIINSPIGIQVSKDIAGTPFRPMDDLWIGDNIFINVATNFTNADDYYIEDINYFLRMPTQELDGFTYTAFPYPHYFVSGEEPPTYTYVAVASWVSPLVQQYNSSSVGFEVSTVGSNETGVTLQIQLYNESVAVYPENFTSASGSFTGLTNGTYTAAVYAVGEHGASDYKTVTFTIAIPADTTTLETTINNPQNTTYTNPSITISITTTTNGTNPITVWNIQFSNGTWLYTENQTYTVATSVIINENVTATLHVWANNTELNSDTANVTFTVNLTDTPTPTDSPAKETASNLLNALLLWGVVPFAVIASVIVVAVKKGLVDRENVDPRVIVAGVSVALFVPFVVMLTVVIVEMIANAF